MARGRKKARIIAIFTALSVALILGAGPALAKTFTCAEGEDCTGTRRADTITGEGSNEISGKRGNDTIASFQSNLYGNGGDDTLLSRGASILDGGGGNDTLEEIDGYADGGTLIGGNLMEGGSGDDRFRVRFGRTEIHGDDGNDVIRAQNGQADTIDCGEGQDTAIFDQGLDTVAANCEEKNP